MKWTDCTADNADFTNDYDRAGREVRRVLGSYDRISNLVYAETGQSVSGVSVRRWLNNRNLPVHLATTLIDLALEAEEDAKVCLFDFFPYLREYTGDPDDSFLE